MSGPLLGENKKSEQSRATARTTIHKHPLYCHFETRFSTFHLPNLRDINECQSAVCPFNYQIYTSLHLMQTSSPLSSPTLSSFLSPGNASFRCKVQNLNDESIELEAIKQASKYPPTSFGELEGFNNLTAGEHFWRNHQPFLKECGYELRPRYHTDWVPSWFETKKNPTECRDTEPLKNPQIIDAVRVSDGNRTEVTLKRLSEINKQNELRALRVLSAEPLRADPRNLCVPVVEILHARHAINTVILVMPKLQHLHHCQSRTVADVLELFRQIIEGYEFLHEQGIAHGDCQWMNIMTFRKPKVKSLFSRNPLEPMISIKKELRSRLSESTSDTQYYVIGFGNSRHFRKQDVKLLSPPSKKNLPGWKRSDPAAEMNPFALDVLRIGQLIQEHFCEVYVNFKFLESLVWAMVHPVPVNRPTISQVALRFEQEMSKLPEEYRRMRLVNRTEHPVVHVLRETRELARSASRLCRRSTSRKPKSRSDGSSLLVPGSEEQSSTSTHGGNPARSILNRMKISPDGRAAITHSKPTTVSPDINKPLPTLSSGKSTSYITISVSGTDQPSTTPRRQVSRKRVPGTSEIGENMQITIERHVHRDSTINIAVSPRGPREPSRLNPTTQISKVDRML